MITLIRFFRWFFREISIRTIIYKCELYRAFGAKQCWFSILPNYRELDERLHEKGFSGPYHHSSYTDSGSVVYL